MPKWTQWLEDDPDDDTPIHNFEPIRKNKQAEREELPPNKQRPKKRTNDIDNR